MSDPINPNTLLPMSLQVDKMEQTRQMQPAHEHSVLSQKKIKDDEKKDNQVNKNQESEHKLIDKDESGDKDQQNRDNNEKKEKKKKGKNDYSRGSYIDVKI